MKNNLEELASELKEKCKGISNIMVRANEDVLDIVLEYGTQLEESTGKKNFEIAHVRRNKTDPELNDFTYLGSYAQAYDSLIDNDFNDEIDKNNQISALKRLLQEKIDEIDKQKDKKRSATYLDLFQGRDENKPYEVIKESICLMCDIFIDKLKKFGKTCEAKE